MESLIELLINLILIFPAVSDLKTQIDDYKKQIEQLHTIILATQKDNQLLIEQKAKRWWKFWE